MPKHISILAKFILTVILMSLIAGACTPVGSQQATQTAGPTATTQPGWYEVYFTTPTDPDASSYRDGIDENLAAAIEQARLSVDVAIYDLNLWSVRDALIAAHRRGVIVRVVAESDNMDEQEIQDLKQAGIGLLGDRQEGLMHDKFVIIDSSEVWTGSMNFTTGGGYLDNNNLIRLRSTKLAEDYSREFDQMFVDDHFGPLKSTGTPNPVVNINGSAIEVYFSPEDSTLEHLLAVIDTAQESIYFLAYSFTSDQIAQALIERAGVGVTVSGVLDKDQYHSNSGTEYNTLSNAGLDVRLDGNSRLMHHKVLIIDRQIVITGSYNFSNNAEHNNDENTLIIHNRDIATLYLAEFQRIYGSSQR